MIFFVARLYHYETRRINETVIEHDKKFDQVFDQLQHEENIKQKIFFEGQIYDAYRFYDRFIVIDNKEMYHLGASIKDLGKKCFGINKIRRYRNYKQGYKFIKLSFIFEYLGKSCKIKKKVIKLLC